MPSASVHRTSSGVVPSQVIFRYSNASSASSAMRTLPPEQMEMPPGSDIFSINRTEQPASAASIAATAPA